MFNPAQILTKTSVFGGLAGIALLAVLSRVMPDFVTSTILNR